MRLQLRRVKALRGDERDMLRRVLAALRRRSRVASRPYEREIKVQLDRLDMLARSLREAPSLYREQRIGPRRRDLASLITALSESTVFDFELHMPLRALIGRTMLMAKVNFFRLIRHVLTDAIEPAASVRNLASQLERILCHWIYAKIVEEILSAIACDAKVEPATRRKAVAMLCTVWENRLTYQVADFFPVLESVWEARRRAKVVFGTLMGASELFELIRAGCDERFIDLFSQQQISADQRLAFEEFLFLTSGPELDLLRDRVRDLPGHSMGPGQAAELLDTSPQRFDLSSQAAEKMYESFRRRHLAAVARRMRPDAGASRTAEEYIMLHLLAQTDLESLMGESAGK